MPAVPRLTCALSLALSVSTAGAHGPTRCDPVPLAEWQSQMALQDKLKAEGWKVRQVKTWNGCYEVYGFDPKGERAEAFFNPKTFERVASEDAPEKK